MNRLLDLLCSFFPQEKPMYVTAECVGGPWDGARINIGHGGHMYEELSHRPDQIAITEVSAIYEWNGLKWYFRHLGKTKPLTECSGK